MHEIIHHLTDHVLIDTIKIIPFLYISYFILDIIEKKSSTYQLNFLFLKHLGPLFGALLGIIPQCGFSIIAASLYAQKGITAGTLVACFISTSDEALPMFLANPSQYKEMGLFLVCKLVIAIIAGYILDLILRKDINEEDDFEIEVDGACNCYSNSFMSALVKTTKTIFFVFLINVVLEVIVHGIGTDFLTTTLQVHPLIQVILTSFIGLIPNCAISILFVQLYMMKALSFGAMIAGLSCGAGVGMAVLFKQNKQMKDTLMIVGYIVLISIISGMLLNQIF